MNMIKYSLSLSSFTIVLILLNLNNIVSYSEDFPNQTTKRNNTNFDISTLVFEPDSVLLILHMRIGQLNGGNGHIQFQKIFILLMMISENSVKRVRKNLSGFSQVPINIQLYAIVRFLMV